jgi:hypothetical protein
MKVPRVEAKGGAKKSKAATALSVKMTQSGAKPRAGGGGPRRLPNTAAGEDGAVLVKRRRKPGRLAQTCIKEQTKLSTKVGIKLLFKYAPVRRAFLAVLTTVGKELGMDTSAFRVRLDAVIAMQTVMESILVQDLAAANTMIRMFKKKTLGPKELSFVAAMDLNPQDRQILSKVDEFPAVYSSPNFDP